MPAQSPPEPIEPIDPIEPVDHTHIADRAKTKVPARAPTPTRWWHRSYYAVQEMLRHHLLSQVEKMSAPAQFGWRNRIFTWWPTLFSQSPLFISWQKARAYFVTQRPVEHRLININKVALDQSHLDLVPRIAIHAHLFYADMAKPLAQYLAGFPYSIDLFISNPNPGDQAFLYEQFSLLRTIGRLQVRLTPNQGRDIAPLIDPFGKALLEYDYIAHIHSKKSINTNSIGNAWCQYLWENLLGTTDQRQEKILALLQNHSMVYPQKYQAIDMQNLRWGEHLKASHTLSEQLGIQSPDPQLSSADYIEFPVGSMFWARADAMVPLLSGKLGIADFDPELGQTDHTLHHTIERNLTRIALLSGKPVAVIENIAFENTYP